MNPDQARETVKAYAADRLLAVAVLFNDSKGIYPRLVGDQDCWDFERDAREYAGAMPIVAHPPCNLWTNLAQHNYRRYGGDHNKPGNDLGRFESAWVNLLLFGGVLEHPARSKAFEHFGIGYPNEVGWTLYRSKLGQKYWVCRVWQATYGHKAQKETWLVYVGEQPPFDLNWAYTEGTHQIGWFDRKKPTVSKREASATPEPFAWELLTLAYWSTLK